MSRFTLKWADGQYKVSLPGIGTMDVVPATDFDEMLNALRVIVAKHDYDATFYRVYTCREKVEPHEIRQARALIARHRGGI